MFFEKRGSLFIGRIAKAFDTPNIVAGFSTRKGGCSRGSFDSLNLGTATAEDPKIIRENRDRYFSSLGIREEQLAVPVQVHSDRVLAVDSSGIYHETDALITNQHGCCLSILTADCVPLFLWDTKRPAVGIVHAGWRGSAKSIAVKTIRMMQQRYSSNPEDITAFIGPSIGPCCYKVKRDVAEQFPSECIHQQHLDLWQVNFMQLNFSGIPGKNIEKAGLCTSCHSEWFYSHRRDAGKTGRMMAVIGLDLD